MTANPYYMFCKIMLFSLSFHNEYTSSKLYCLKINFGNLQCKDYDRMMNARLSVYTRVQYSFDLILEEEFIQ